MGRKSVTGDAPLFESKNLEPFRIAGRYWKLVTHPNKNHRTHDGAIVRQGQLHLPLCSMVPESYTGICTCPANNSSSMCAKKCGAEGWELWPTDLRPIANIFFFFFFFFFFLFLFILVYIFAFILVFLSSVHASMCSTTAQGKDKDCTMGSPTFTKFNIHICIKHPEIARPSGCDPWCWQTNIRKNNLVVSTGDPLAVSKWRRIWSNVFAAFPFASTVGPFRVSMNCRLNSSSDHGLMIKHCRCIDACCIFIHSWACPATNISSIPWQRTPA